ncbi:MAG: AsmA family protein [Chlamydiales bacterium]|nr:AsmA family protein [Chlamydiia bacterium]MCP5504819.1 AsmA family protein [Chlamydiales bacterium]
MKRVIGILLAIIIVLCGATYLAYRNADLIFAEIISRKAKVPITIKKVQFNKESFQIEEFQMANPKGARLPTALKVETIKVDSPYRQYFEDPITIDQIHVNNVYVNIQIYNKEQTKGNWHTIMNNMEKEHNSPLSIERPAIIKKLILTNIKIDLILSDGSMHDLSPINRLEFDNLDSEKGIPIQEISEIIVQKMMNSIFLEKGLKSIIEAPVDIIKGVLPFL